jgi:hypothetical protein
VPPDNSSREESIVTREAAGRAWFPWVATALLLLSGCATSRGTLDYTPRASTNPGQGATLRIATVQDSRRFELRPSDPSIPSLKNGEIEDRSITSRAIARKRNGYGKALGDILLPEGRSVAEIVRAAVARGLREGGYRVLEEGEPGYGDAAPIDVEIRQFWMWITPGFWAVHLEFRTLVVLKGAIPPLAEGPQIEGYVRLASQAAAERAWQNTLDAGLENFNANLLQLLQAKRSAGAAAAPGTP